MTRAEKLHQLVPAGILFFLLLVLSIPIITGSAVPAQPLTAKKGVLDLSAWDFQSRGNAPLDGEWSFSWNSFTEPLSATSLKDKNFITIPSTWTSGLISGEKLPATGYATCSLRVILPDNAPRVLAFRLPPVDTSMTWYLNGNRMGSNGSTGSIPAASSVQNYAPATVTFPAEKELFITIHLSNFQYPRPGIRNSILLGDADTMALMNQRLFSADMFLIGAIIIMGLYHLGLYAVRRKDKTPLFFFLFCMLIGLRLMVTGEGFAYHVGAVTWRIGTFLEYLTYYLSVPVFFYYLYYLYPDESVVAVNRGITVVSIIAALVVIATPVMIYARTVVPFHLFFLFTVLYFLVIIIRAIIAKRESSIIFFIGGIILMVTSINDVLTNMRVLNSVYLVPLGLFIFFFSQSFIILYRFSIAFTSVENLTRELEDYSSQLEERVNERTIELKEARDLLLADLNLATVVQQAFLPKSIRSCEELDIAYRYSPMMGIGGDFLDIYRDEKNGIIELFICDVSGHGIPAALLTAMVKMTLGSWDEHVGKPAQFMGHIRDQLAQNLGSNFLTAALVSVSVKTGECRYANAGHPPLLIVKKNGKAQKINTRGILMCAGLVPEYHETTFVLEDDDLAILYTDGVIEAERDREPWGIARLEQLAETFSTCTPHEESDLIINKLGEFTGHDSFNDDLSLVAFRFNRTGSTCRD